MSPEIRFFVPGIARPQGSMTPILGQDSGKPRAIHGKNLQPWRDAVAWSAIHARGGGRIPYPMPTAISLHLLFLMRRPKKPRAAWPVTRPDLDKLERAICDALQGVLYDDDSQVCIVLKGKVYAEAEETPGVLVSADLFDEPPEAIRRDVAAKNRFSGG